MPKKIEKDIKEIISRLETLSKEKYSSNVQIAKAVKCTEGAVRYLFRHKKGMTMDLYLKFCSALGIEPDELLKNLWKSNFRRIIYSILRDNSDFFLG